MPSLVTFAHSLIYAKQYPLPQKHPNADLKAYHNYQNCIVPKPADVSALQNPLHIHLNQNNKPVSGLRIQTLKSIRLLLQPTFNLIKAPHS